MEPDTEGGRIQRAARHILLQRHEGFIHAMQPHPGDPPYTRTWVEVASSLDGIEVIVPDQASFLKWSEFLLPPNRGGTSQLHVVPKAIDCFRGPHSADKSWLISDAHIINFGRGEDSRGIVVSHVGAWFTRVRFDQAAPDEINVRQPQVLTAAAWTAKRDAIRAHAAALADSSLLPSRKHNEPIQLPHPKVKDLCDLGQLMSRDENAEDFLHVYPVPTSVKDKKAFHMREELARSVFRKNPKTWLSADYYALLKWKMKTGAAKFKTVAARKAQWAKIADQSDADNMALEPSQRWDAPTLESSNLEVPWQGGNDRDAEERVDDDENFLVDDVPFHGIDLARAKSHKKATIGSLSVERAEELKQLGGEEQAKFLEEKYWALKDAPVGGSSANVQDDEEADEGEEEEDDPQDEGGDLQSEDIELIEDDEFAHEEVIRVFGSLADPSADGNCGYEASLLGLLEVGKTDICGVHELRQALKSHAVQHADRLFAMKFYRRSKRKLETTETAQLAFEQRKWTEMLEGVFTEGRNYETGAPREGWLDGPFHLPIVADKFKVNIVLYVVASLIPYTEIYRRNKTDGSIATETLMDVLRSPKDIGMSRSDTIFLVFLPGQARCQCLSANPW